MLVVKQVLREQSHWNLPGGSLEPGETLGDCLVREMEEETGLDVEVGELLYLCDRRRRLGNQTLDACFAVRRVGGRLRSGLDAPDEHLGEVRMVPLRDLPSYGFSEHFVWLADNGFPGKGSYQGDYHRFYDAA